MESSVDGDEHSILTRSHSVASPAGLAGAGLAGLAGRADLAGSSSPGQKAKKINVSGPFAVESRLANR